MIIRPEQPTDQTAIFDLTVMAFEPMPYGDGTEAPIINDLRKDGDLTISLVAVKEDKVIGQITFSPVSIDGLFENWYGLGPVSVHPDIQGQGVGSQLINEGLAILKSLDAKGCALIGNPDYYQRFGFISDGNLTYRDLSTKYVQWLSFGGDRIHGELKFSPAFEQ